MVAQRYHGVKHLTPLAISEQLNLTLCLSPLDTHIMLVTEGEGRSAKAQYQAVHVHMERLTALPEGKRQKVVTKRSYEYYSLFYCYTKIELPSLTLSLSNIPFMGINNGCGQRHDVDNMRINGCLGINHTKSVAMAARVHGRYILRPLFSGQHPRLRSPDVTISAHFLPSKTILAGE
jgi:hypothetical protein